MSLQIRTADVVQYIKPLREGGSLPAIVEASDGFHYVMKFRGAGQGKKALIAELIGGELARVLGLKVPEIVFLHLDEGFHKAEGDEEIQDLLKFSVGLNLGLHYLSGSITYDPLVSEADSFSSSLVILLDSIITNIDRTAKNTNLLNWNKELWLIDHGASLYFHHHWATWESHVGRSFPLIKQHVLLHRAKDLQAASQKIKDLLTKEKIEEIVELIPMDFLEEPSSDLNAVEMKTAYATILWSRIERLDELVKEIEDAR
jgi:hypothetical protein